MISLGQVASKESRGLTLLPDRGQASGISESDMAGLTLLGLSGKGLTLTWLVT